jgi:hypothetical protein
MRNSSSAMGASTPMVSYVGNRPVSSVGTDIMKMPSVNMRLRPNISPKCAITMPPSGRIR